jgi:hypothetical protein
MYTGFNLFGLRVETTDHCDNRIKNRCINIKDIISTLKKYPGIKKYNNTGKELCIRKQNLSLFIEIRFNKIVLITAINKYAKYVKEAVVI